MESNVNKLVLPKPGVVRLGGKLAANFSKSLNKHKHKLSLSLSHTQKDVTTTKKNICWCDKAHGTATHQNAPDLT